MTVGIVGAGAFGTALGCVLAEAGTPVSLYGRDPARMAEIAANRVNPRLPAIELPGRLTAETGFASLSGHDMVLLAVPSAAQAAMARELAGLVAPEATLVMCAKGLDRETGQPITERLAAALPGRSIAVLSGPGFAADIAAGLPTAMTLAAGNLARAEAVAAELSRKTFRLYASGDLIGVQLCGALKNVLAIAAGVVIGAGLGESARAALIARGLAELTRFVSALGGAPETAAGLAGLGDLVLTATSTQSRNFRYGVALGEGAPPDEPAATGGTLVEGAAAAVTACRTARKRGIAMPITDAVAAIVTGEADVPAAVDRLLSRPLRPETG